MNDFDADGIPDLAVADASFRSGDANTCIELIVSGQRRVQLRLHGIGEPVKIDAVDIDQDRDLDLLVSKAVGGQPVAVWLNDGHGRFRHGILNNVPLSSSLRNRPALCAYDAPVVVATARGDELFPCPATGGDPSADMRDAPVVTRAAAGPSITLLLNVFPRPPPSLSFH